MYSLQYRPRKTFRNCQYRNYYSRKVWKLHMRCRSKSDTTNNSVNIYLKYIPHQ